MATIFIVDDDQAIGEMLSLVLENEGFQTVTCLDGLRAVEMFPIVKPDLILLDVMLPGLDGTEVARRIRATSNVPIIMLTAREEENDKVLGLELGADDYITKPFSLAVLRARVNTQLRRKAIQETAVCLGKYRFDFQCMEFYAEGRPVELSKTEQKLLRIFIENRGITLSRGSLVDRVWTDGAEYVDENALSVTVKRLRDKLGAKDDIKTVYGKGYMWVKEDE